MVVRRSRAHQKTNVIRGRRVDPEADAGGVKGGRRAAAGIFGKQLDVVFKQDLPDKLRDLVLGHMPARAQTLSAAEGHHETRCVVECSIRYEAAPVELGWVGPK